MRPTESPAGLDMRTPRLLIVPHLSGIEIIGHPPTLAEKLEMTHREGKINTSNTQVGINFSSERLFTSW